MYLILYTNYKGGQFFETTSSYIMTKKFVNKNKNKFLILAIYYLPHHDNIVDSFLIEE